MTATDARLARINTMRDVEAMVALDNINLLTQRVTNLLSHGRRMTLCRRYTYVDSPPDVTAGLTLNGSPQAWSKDDSAGFTVRLQPGVLAQFGFAAYAHDGSATEQEAWRRYHAAEGISKDWSKRRRDMTLVQVTGGLPGDGPARDDALVIRCWNGDGVCTETVVAFDYETGGHNSLTRARAELREHLARLDSAQPWENRDVMERTLRALDAV